MASVSVGRLRYLGNRRFEAEHRISDKFKEGGVYNVLLAKDRSPESHNQFFAVLADAFHQIPDDRQQWLDPNHMRKWLLCHVAKWCNHADIVMTTPGDALKMYTMLNESDPYAIIEVNGNVFRKWTAKSMKMANGNNGGMSATDFQRVKSDIFDWLDDYLGLERGTLAKNGGKAA